jgi:hypothetical protein
MKALQIDVCVFTRVVIRYGDLRALEITTHDESTGLSRHQVRLKVLTAHA